MNKHWLLVINGAFFETFWVSGLKYGQTFMHFILTAICLFISFFSMLKACEKIEIGTVYAVFVGLGAAFVVLADMFYFGAYVSPLKLVFIALLVLGVIGLKISGKH